MIDIYMNHGFRNLMKSMFEHNFVLRLTPSVLVQKKLWSYYLGVPLTTKTKFKLDFVGNQSFIYQAAAAQEEDKLCANQKSVVQSSASPHQCLLAQHPNMFSIRVRFTEKAPRRP